MSNNFKPKSVIRPQCSKILAIALFPNIFYFLVGRLAVFGFNMVIALQNKYSCKINTCFIVSAINFLSFS